MIYIRATIKYIEQYRCSSPLELTVEEEAGGVTQKVTVVSIQTVLTKSELKHMQIDRSTQH